MEYQVWTHEEYEGWVKVDCGDKEAAMREIDKALRLGGEPLLTVEIPYKVSIELEEERLGEAPKGKARPDKSARSESKSEVRPGVTEPVQELGEGSGDNIPGDTVPGQ